MKQGFLIAALLVLAFIAYMAMTAEGNDDMPAEGSDDVPANRVSYGSPEGAVEALADAIANAEGFGVTGAIPTRANNPGDLELGNVGNGVLGEGITIFSTLEEGWNRLRNEVSLILSGQSKYYHLSETFEQLGKSYANDSTGAWASNVANALGVSTDTVLSDWLAGYSS